MTPQEFLSIRDAAELAGVSKKTIERAYKKYIDHPKLGPLIEKRPVGNSHRFFVKGRLKPGVTVIQAQVAADGVAEDFTRSTFAGVAGKLRVAGIALIIVAALFLRYSSNSSSVTPSVISFNDLFLAFRLASGAGLFSGSSIS